MPVLSIIMLSNFLCDKTAVSQDNASKEHPNIILIVSGTLRADHLSCYGYGKNTSPNIDKLACDGILFKNTHAQSNWTLPSHASILTGRYPSAHRVMEREDRLSLKELTLPEILKLYGYKTAAFTGGLDLRKEHNLNQGFDSYYDEKALATSDELIPQAEQWLEKNRNQKFFLYLHTYDTHLPYQPKKPYDTMFSGNYKGPLKQEYLTYPILKTIQDKTLTINSGKIPLTETDIDYIKNQYDGEIASLDKNLGQLFNALEKLKIDDKTIIIFTADHGEELFDHNSFDRFGTENLYDEVIHIPLIIKLPLSLKSQTINSKPQSDTPAGSIDIMPTILKLLNIPINKEAQGKSLLPFPTQESNDFVFAEASKTKQMIRNKEWKLIRKIQKDNKGVLLDEQYELYNLKNDPYEQDEISRKNPKQVLLMAQALLNWLKQFQNSDSQKAIITPEMRQELIDAGYW